LNGASPLGLRPDVEVESMFFLAEELRGTKISFPRRV